MTQHVWVATYSHKYGNDVCVFHTKEKAELWREEVAASWFDKELPDIKRPDTPSKLADVYFANVYEESFDIEQMAVL